MESIAPRPRWFGREGIYDALVLEHLGPSLENILQDPSCNGHKFPLSTVVGIADQLVCIPIYVCGDILINTYVDITIGVFTFIELCPLQPGARQHPNRRHRWETCSIPIWLQHCKAISTSKNMRSYTASQRSTLPSNSCLLFNQRGYRFWSKSAWWYRVTCICSDLPFLWFASMDSRQEQQQYCPNEAVYFKCRTLPGPPGGAQEYTWLFTYAHFPRQAQLQYPSFICPDSYTVTV